MTARLGHLMRGTLAASLLLCGQVAIARAGDDPSGASPGYRRAYDWSGVYLGAHAGGGWANTSWSNVDVTGEPMSFSGSGFLGGGHIGIQRQIGRLVIGAETSFSGFYANSVSLSAVDPTTTYHARLQDLFTVAGRLGLAVDSLLLYGKAGYASARIEADGSIGGGADSFATTLRSDGYLLGTGIEWHVGSGVILGLEYDYAKLGNTTITDTTAGGLPYAVSGIGTEIHAVTARVGYKYNHAEVDEALK